MTRRPFPADAATLHPGAVRGGVNVVHVRLARLAAALRAPRPASMNVRRHALAALVVYTVLINMVIVATPLVTLALFDYVVRDGATFTLACLCAVGGIGVVYELMLRRERGDLAADIGVKAAASLASSRFRSLLTGDIDDVAPAAVEQFRRLRRLRGFLTGPSVTALLDAPFTLALVVCLFAYGGALGFVPLGAIAAHALVAHVLRPYAQRTALHGARARENLRVALAESAAKRETLDEIGMRAPWSARIEALAVEAATRRGKDAVAHSALDAASHAITALAVIAALWIGAAAVMNGSLTVGAVVAATMVVWRCIAPMETVFRSWTQVRTATETARNGARARDATRPTRSEGQRLEGRIAVRGLVVRHDAAPAPALRGVSFDVAPGELVAICGAAGAGKSTLLKALLGLQKAESGTIAIDGRDLRGLETTGYRTQVAWAPQRPTLFHGSVAQNIRLMAPAATDSGMIQALARAGVTLPHPQLRDGVETRLRSGGGGELDESLRVRIMLAGLYAKDARIYLLDDPGAFLDRDGDRAFLRTLHSLRGQATVLLVTNRPSHMRVCDRILRLEHGMVVSDGPVDKVLGR